MQSSPLPPRIPRVAFAEPASHLTNKCFLELHQQASTPATNHLVVQTSRRNSDVVELSPRKSLRQFAADVLSMPGQRFQSSIKRHSRSDYDIRRCSDLSKNTTTTNTIQVQQMELAETPRAPRSGDAMMNRFRSICTIVSCCLAEVLVMTGSVLVLYVMTVKGLNEEYAIQLNTVHILIGHLLLSPLMYSYGFAPIKKRIQRAFPKMKRMENSRCKSSMGNMIVKAMPATVNI